MYYPPRARWYSVAFYFGTAIRRRLALDRLVMPRAMKIGELAMGFLVPGLAVYFRGPKLWGRVALWSCFGLFLTYVVWLGYAVANIAFGLLISIHCTGLVYYCGPLMAKEPFRSRIAFTLLVLMAMMLLLYWPARNLIQQHFLMPLRMNGHVIVVRHIFHPNHIQRGDWVAYAFDQNGVGDNYHGGTVWLRDGISLGPVLALPGDTVTFSTNSFSVNGILHTNLPHMPTTGGITVAENHWFIWPNLDISGHGNVGEARITSALLGLSNVPESNFFGKPLNRWLWRKQVLP